MPEKRIAPPLVFYYTMILGVKQTRKHRKMKEKPSPDVLFPGWSSLLYKFLRPIWHPRQKKNRTRKRSPDAAKFDSVSPVQFGQDPLISA